MFDSMLGATAKVGADSVILEQIQDFSRQHQAGGG
jgi:hypothetical protein